MYKHFFNDSPPKVAGLCVLSGVEERKSVQEHFLPSNQLCFICRLVSGSSVYYRLTTFQPPHNTFTATGRPRCTGLRMLEG